MEYMSGLIDGTILVDGVVRSVLAKTNGTEDFWAHYDAEMAHLRNIVSRCREDEVRSFLEERA